MVWRIENRKIDDKREYLIRILNTYDWNRYVKRLQKIQKRHDGRTGQGENLNLAGEMMEEINAGHEKAKKARGN